MAQTPIHTTFVGRLVADPEVRYTNDGKPVASFTIASSQRVYNKQTGQWEDGEATFLGCTAWSKLAEGVATLGKGQRVIATGVLRQRRWEGQDGQKRSKLELTAGEVGTSVLFATDNNGGGGNQPRNQQQTGQNKTPWNNPSTPAKASWNAGGFNTDDQPPF